MAAVSTESICPTKQEKGSTNDLKCNYVLNDDDVTVIVQRKLGKKDFHILDWCLDPSASTNGFLGQYYTLRVTVKIENGIRTLKFFAKTPPPKHSPQYEFLERYDTFNKEVIVYTELMTRMGTGRGNKWLVDCYLCKRNSVIVLEDATADGYVTVDKYVPFDESHCIWMLRALSRFHSRSLILDNVLRRDGHSIPDVYGNLLEEVLFREYDERSRNALRAGVKGANTLIDLVEGFTLEERTLIKDRFVTWSDRLPRLLEPSKKYRNVICHRDIWPNNMMFKKDKSGAIVGCYILDYQFLRYCPPAYDFTFFLYLSTDRATRDKHYESFARIYYDSLKKALMEEGHDVGDDLTWELFCDSCRYARPVAILYAMLNLQIMLLSSETVRSYFGGSPDELERVLYNKGREELVRQQYQTVMPFRQRLTEIVFEIRDNLPDEPPDA